MILKSLILQGFKSFPDRTEIRFLGGVTAIVGPNGSGKSNISDAIRWVLGEQSSRSLRGSKMEDVIFGGTAKRRALGFAEVSLILDNETRVFRSDFSEIMVTRRYYRSGESEYFLNKKHCRLRDIHELFMDTGLGRDGYSTIGQGRIDEILAQKSEDRREIFEEAAGVTKFRVRKEESERKLAATAENLVRIRDIYTELENQAGPLAKQAEKAKQYLALRDELRVLEITLWLMDLEQIGMARQKNQTDTQTCDTQLSGVREQQQTLYDRSEALSAELRQIEIEAEQLRGRLREMEQSRAERQSRCAVLQADIRNLKENIVRAETEAAHSGDQLQDTAENLAAHRRRGEELAAARTACQEELFALEKEMQDRLDARAGLAAACGQAEQAVSVLEEAFHRFEKEQAAARAGLDGMDTRRDTIGADVERAAAEVAAEEQNRTEYQEALKKCGERLTAVRNRISGVALKRESRRNKAEQLTRDTAAAEAACTDNANRIRMLEEMQREYEGFSRSVKAIMQRKANGAGKGIHAPVSALITVEDTYVTAIETALGAAASHIVVDSPAIGKSCIEYLKRSDNGRATFLPLDTIRPSVLRENGLESHPGFCGTADSLVSADPAYRTIIQNLLARTVVAENMDCALRIARAYGNRFRIVTLDGQVIQSGGAMTGGSVSKSTGVLARASKLAALREKHTILERTRSDLQLQLKNARRELNTLENDIGAIEDERIHTQEEEARLTATLGQHSTLLDSLRGRYEALQLEQSDLSAARERYQQTIDSIAASIAENRAQYESAEAERERAQSALESLEQAQQNSIEAVNEHRADLARMAAEAETESRAAIELENLLNEMKNSAARSQQNIAQFRTEIERAEADLAAQQAMGETERDDLAGVQRLIEGTVEQRMRVEADRTRVDKNAIACNDSILALEREAARLQSTGVQLQEQERQILDKMWEGYELTPTPAQELRVELEDIPAARKQASDLRSRIRALGAVNPDAVQEFEALNERLTFLGEQKDDLEKAQNELRQVIDQLTVHMKEIFASEFAKLNVCFGETFREMFGGGNASLVLADTADILNCGIDIHVSLPGKTVKTITLLSGGERAFVAIALYFAILKVRPTPFCILDEIEAALDDVNVVRYAQYLRRLTDNTQFIVITHRRGTMEEADMLYGVTMQEQGVSRLLMLNLAEAEKAMGSELR